MIKLHIVFPRWYIKFLKALAVWLVICFVLLYRLWLRGDAIVSDQYGRIAKVRQAVADLNIQEERKMATSASVYERGQPTP